MILGGLLMDNARLDDIELRQDDFINGHNRRVYEAIRATIDKGLDADLHTIAQEVLAGDTSVPVGYIAALTDDVPSAANMEFYVSMVREASLRRKVQHLGHQILDWTKDKTSEDVLDATETALTELLTGGGGGVHKLKDYIIPAIERIETAYKAGGKYTGVTTGFHKLDAMTAGFQNGDLVVIAARTSIGKTTLALNIACHAARRNGVRVAFFSCEMSGESLATRVFASEIGIDLWELRTGKLKESDFARLTDAAGRMHKLPIWLDDTPNISLSTLRSRCRKFKRIGIDIIFVDYITLIKHGDSRMPRHERVGEVCKGLKQLARELNVPVVVMSQLTRNAEDKPPTLADLRQSGEIEEDADVIIFLHRKREQRTKVVTDVIVAKQRNGPVDTVQLMFLPDQTRFVNMEEER